MPPASTSETPSLPPPRPDFLVVLVRRLRSPAVTLLLVAILGFVVLPKFWYLLERQREMRAQQRAAPRVVPTFELKPLAAGATREPLLVIDPAALKVALLVEVKEPASLYAGRLSAANGTTLWEGRELAAGPAGFLLLSLPAESLPAGRYRLELQSCPRGGVCAALEALPFTVSRPALPLR